MVRRNADRSRGRKDSTPRFDLGSSSPFFRPMLAFVFISKWFLFFVLFVCPYVDPNGSVRFCCSWSANLKGCYRWAARLFDVVLQLNGIWTDLISLHKFCATVEDVFALAVCMRKNCAKIIISKLAFAPHILVSLVPIVFAKVDHLKVRWNIAKRSCSCLAPLFYEHYNWQRSTFQEAVFYEPSRCL